MVVEGVLVLRAGVPAVRSVRARVGVPAVLVLWAEVPAEAVVLLELPELPHLANHP